MNKPVSDPPQRVRWLAALLALTVAGGGYWLSVQQRSETARTAAPAASAPVVVSGPVETAPSAEPAQPVITLDRRESFGRAAGLHKTKDPLRLASSAALVIDQQTQQVLYQKNDLAILPIASLTKLMTAILVAEAKLPLEQRITITEEDVDTERNSRSRLRVGTTLTRGEALHLALMSSENRAAHALGRTAPGGLQQFVAAMNRKARALGMGDTTFVDPTGLSNLNQSTARDVATMVAAANRYPLLREYSTTPQHRVDFDGRQLNYLNSNRLVRSGSWEIDLQKTGYIIEAGQCVAMATRLAGQSVILVLLDSTDKHSRSADAERVRRWASSLPGAENHNVAAAPEPTRKVAKTKVAKARTQAKPERTQVAKRKQDGKTKVAQSKASSAKTKLAKSKPAERTKVAEGKGGRVKVTLSADKPPSKTRLAEGKGDPNS